MVMENIMSEHRRHKQDHDDWDLIVDAALAAGNLGNKGVDVEDLKEALFPPQNYSDRYMSAPG
ncbi:uncharacterized protein J4E92_010599 [Alternaria infectoria]|nr:uncharacterized protein J4E92_010599 [Alternaria infectoria]KAI4909681.1 hypothetical protein J4E92_010599 [Alternaria infectoria]